MFISHSNIGINESQSSRAAKDFELFKMLLQPHFLFNSLNNLYALSVRESGRTSEAIAGLSELLEKVVKFARQDYISLSDEVAMIRDYINLEKIWLGETSFCLDLRISGDADTCSLPPLVLYTLVENCFKHGIRKCQGDGWAKISITTKKERIIFRASNSVPQWEQVEMTNNHKGIGVEAVQQILDRRCNGRYKLSSSSSSTAYHVDLEIQSTGIES